MRRHRRVAARPLGDRHMMKKYRPLLAAPAALLLGACAGMGNEIPSWGPDLVAVTASNKLITFNPVDGKLRVLSDAGQNLVVDADSGAAQAESGFDSAKVSAVAAAYTTQPNGPFATTLYVINSKGAEISSSIAPSSGKLMTVGAIGSDIGKPAGFDIRGNEAAGVAYAATAAPDASSSKLYLVKLSAGSVKSLGT